jgi:hypothetical protein
MFLIDCAKMGMGPHLSIWLYLEIFQKFSVYPNNINDGNTCSKNDFCGVSLCTQIFGSVQNNMNILFLASNHARFVVAP